MTLYFVLVPRRTAWHRDAAFTLIELLTVMAIILLLAGLVLGLASNAQTKAARSRAEGEIQAFSTAINNYQIDNGGYPRSTDTDSLNARASTPPDPSGSTSSCAKASLLLYKLISGNYYYNANGTLTQYNTSSSSGSSVTKPTVYYQFKNSQLQNSNNTTNDYIDPATVTAVVDPFGFSYGYSTIYVKEVENNTASGTTTLPLDGFNSTYDLWSTAGYSKSGGKQYPTDGSLTAANDYTLWIKNW